MECTSTRHKTGSYNGIPIFIKFIEYEYLTLTRDDLLELELVRLTAAEVLKCDYCA